MALRSVLERAASLLRGKEPPAMELLQGGERYNQTLILIGILWAAVSLGGGLFSILIDGPQVPSFHRHAIFLFMGVAFIFSVIPLSILRRLNVNFTDAFAFSGVFGGLSQAIIIGLAGPLHQETAAIIPAWAASMFLLTSRRTAYVTTATSLGGYIVSVVAVHGFVDPATRIGIVTTFTVTMAAGMAWTAQQLRHLAARERASAAEVNDLAGELAEVNDRLEERVAQQVERIDSLGRLERFLSPQVAHAVLSSKDSELLEPHRRQIAVLFCDLRGFTSFTSSAAPEEVVEVLGGYYDAAGELIEQHDATLGSFEGDGVMAYFNDPFPCNDPPWEAVSMAQELRHSLRALQLRWEAKGFHLGFGIGIAWGYATLGTFGFKGRRDYTALGTVVNLASRLCGQAADGEILLDARAHEAVLDRIDATPIDIELKGFRGPVHAYQL